ncbi:MAG: hypothetical protein IJ877_07625 [Candidatus Gastranaerophilales bacterium]|nr:hypothetical protein [Candidatus Gastranaerophilales bacterium]
MFEGVYSSIATQPVADFGAQRTLNMGGSVIGYIQTGNQYDKRYYKPRLKNDTFQNKKSKNRFDKIITISALALASAAVVAGLVSKGKIKCEFLSKGIESVKNLFKKDSANPHGILSRVGSGISNLFSKIRKPKP